MKRYIYLIIFAILIFGITANSQDVKSQYKLTSERMDDEGKNLDKQITELNNKISRVIKKYNLKNTKAIRVLPYRFSYKLGADFIEMERYVFLKDEIYRREVIGIKTKSIKIYTNGQIISRIESKIYENNHDNNVIVEVEINDPSPLAAGTDDVIFTHKKSGKILLNKKRLANIKNTTAFPLRNQVKRSFLIPHLTFFYNSLLFIAESYSKSLKDSDSELNEFLKQSLKY